MTVLKDVRTLVADAIKAAVAFLEGGKPEETTTYNKVIDVPAKPSAVVPVDKSNVKAAIIDLVTTLLISSPASSKTRY